MGRQSLGFKRFSVSSWSFFEFQEHPRRECFTLEIAMKLAVAKDGVLVESFLEHVPLATTATTVERKETKTFQRF